MPDRPRLVPVPLLLEALAWGDTDQVLGCLAPSIVLDAQGDAPCLPYAGIFHGPAGVAAYLELWWGAAFLYDFQPCGISLPAHGLVLVHGHETMRFRASGQDLRSLWIHLFAVGHEGITRWTIWRDGMDQLRAHLGQ